jgi:hypothetical protein
MSALPLPDFLFDTHKRYKADTNRVSQWLAETAQKCGFDLGPQPSTSRLSGRLKGKARKAARLNPSPATTASSPHIVTVQGFTDTAEFIVQQTPPIRVPDTVLGLLRSAVNLRQRCSTWFQKQSNQEDLGESTDKHSHFIGILEDVLKILEPHSRSAPSQDDIHQSMEKLSLNAKSKLPAEHDHNPYDVWFIDEDASVAEISPALEPRPEAKRTKRVPSTVRYEMEATDEEFFFGVFCFFDDLNRLRDFLDALWVGYKEGTCDLISASVTTNCALELVQRHEKDFVTLFPKCDTFTKMASLIYDSTRISGGERLQPSGGPNNSIDIRMLAMADWLFMRVHDTLATFLPYLQDDAIPVFNEPRAPSTYNPSADRSKLTIHERIEEDEVLMTESLTDFFLYDWVVAKAPVTDKLLDGIRLMSDEKIVPTWLVFAAAVYLDIRHILREDIERGFAELQASAAQAKSALTQYFATNATFPHWPRSREEAVDFVRDFVDFWIISDPVELHRPRYVDYPVSHRLLRRNPLLCGLYQFKLHLLMQEEGIHVANAYGSILYVAHLYEACRKGRYTKYIHLDRHTIVYACSYTGDYFCGPCSRDSGRIAQNLDVDDGCFGGYVCKGRS